MREDMYKVIIERPRPGKSWGLRRTPASALLRQQVDAPTRLGMRAGYGYLWREDLLSPLRRYLRAQVGRPWDKVYSEICATTDRRNTLQRHLHQHLHHFIATNVLLRNGQVVDPTILPEREFYVDPRTGLIRAKKDYRAARRQAVERRQLEEAEAAARRRVLDERTLLLLLEGLWFRVIVETLPEERSVEVIIDGRPQRQLAAESRYDVVQRRQISRAVRADGEKCAHLYGARELYAVSKRQLSSREIRAHRLR